MLLFHWYYYNKSEWSFIIISLSTAEGTVDCLYTQAVGSVSYVSVLNKGTVDYSAYQRFTCLVRLEFLFKKSSWIEIIYHSSLLYIFLSLSHK